MAFRLAAHMDSGPIDYGASRKVWGQGVGRVVGWAGMGMRGRGLQELQAYVKG